MNEEKDIRQNDETKEDTGFDARPSTVFYEQWYKTISAFPIKERDKAYKYIFEYAFYGIEPDVQDKDKTSVSYVVFGMARPNVNSAQKRYDAATDNGKKGGRPKKVTELVRTNIIELRKKGLTQQQVAIELGLSLKTIQRVEKDISQNHNVNVNDNVNDNVNVKCVASDDGNTKSATPPTESATPAPATELSEMDIYNNQVAVIKLYRNRKKIKEIVDETGLEYGFVNDTVDWYMNNGKQYPPKPIETKAFDVPLMNGGYLSKTKDELFNVATNNGKICMEEVNWQKLEQEYIMYGIAPQMITQLIKEFKQKLTTINNITVFPHAI